ncbi:MAG: gamma carbonic anhydrase family protein [Fibrobacter sp.]|jgi:carbonic anhydrase/acetyltransferase-like protein (isoleucine patch superfamily)|uniref:gamma carbonic anhydrase family protein n=1 Tax=Fibrobacter TaxID=832 RepID=UPI00156332B9|nr:MULTISPECIES: gamma carbonic anhydrase family protein [Fibrobacter]MBQ7080697.1 gamma carbonic anhydrase family protein [Fibrobacter sp.]
MGSLIKYKGKVPQVGERVFLAEGACLVGDVSVGDDSSVFYNAVIRADLAEIKIGKRTNIQDNVCIHVSTGVGVNIGDEVTVGHGAVLHGCTIEDNVLIGMGAILMDGSHIKKNCIIGAGALVTHGKEFPEGSLVMGAPAHVVRTLTTDELKNVKIGVEHYLDAKDELLKDV